MLLVGNVILRLKVLVELVLVTSLVVVVILLMAVSFILMKVNDSYETSRCTHTYNVPFWMIVCCVIVLNGFFGICNYDYACCGVNAGAIYTFSHLILFCLVIVNTILAVCISAAWTTQNI